MIRLTAMLVAVAALMPCSEARAQTPQVLFGGRHGVALRTNGDVLTWGLNQSCQLGRPVNVESGISAMPTLMMRNVKEIAVAVDHNLALTVDGKMYGWGASGPVLGLGHQYEQCEGPALVESMADKTITHVASGYGFSVAVTSTGDLYCTGANDMLQCPSVKGPPNVFLPVPFPELAGKVKAVNAGMFHTLVLTTDHRLFAFGRGRDGQLGPGPMANGFRAIAVLTDVVAIAAGTWHSAALRADGSVWLWGNNAKSQLCDGTTVNRADPVRVTLPADARVAEITAGGHSTMMRTTDGVIYACGDNQNGLLGLDGQQVVARPAPVPIGASRAARLSMGGGHAAVSADGCSVRLAGMNDVGMIDSSPAVQARTFTPRADLTLCGTRPASPLATLVFEYPKGGASGCWSPVPEPGADAAFAPLRQTLMAAQAMLKANKDFMTAPVPVRFRTGISVGPQAESGAMMHIKVVPERKTDLTRLWTGPCDVIPQIDRIGGAIAQVSVFVNHDVRDQFLGSGNQPPTLMGHVAGYPVYNHWIVITRDGRLPWLPQTLADRLDVIGERREKALADWKAARANDKPPDPAVVQRTYELLKKSDAASAEKYVETMKATTEELKRRQQSVYPAMTSELEKQIADYKTYRGSFTAEQLKMAAVLGDPSGTERRRTEGSVAAVQALTSDEQRQADEWGQQSRALERQAQAETARRNTAEAARLRAEATALANKVRTLRSEHVERVTPAIQDLHAQYELTNLKPGPSDRAIGAKPDPALPNYADPNRAQVITVQFGEEPDPKQVERRAWRERYAASFDIAVLAALLR